MPSQVHFSLLFCDFLKIVAAVAITLVPGLDTLFGGRCTHHREIQEHESGQFLALFKKEGGVTYVDKNGKSSYTAVDLSNFTV